MEKSNVVDYGQISSNLNGIATLIESLGKKITTIGRDKDDIRAFYLLSEMIQQESEKIEELFDEYMQIEETMQNTGK